VLDASPINISTRGVRDDGAVVFTNGNAVYLLHPDGRKEHLLNEVMIEQVFFVPTR
jgi:hypothetical protein